MSEYDTQARKFLDDNGLKFRATQKGDRCPPYCDGKCIHGDRYRVTISRKGGGRLSFDYWNSFADIQAGKEATAYDALTCISSEITCADNFEDFCGDFGYESDSRKAEELFRRCDRFARRLRAFFTPEEQEQLSTIQ